MNYHWDVQITECHIPVGFVNKNKRMIRNVQIPQGTILLGTTEKFSLHAVKENTQYTFSETTLTDEQMRTQQ